MSAIATKNKCLQFQATTRAVANAAGATRPTDETDADSTNWITANFNSASIDESRESIEVTLFKDDKRDRIYGLADVSGSGDGVYSDSDSAYKTLKAGMRNEVYFWVRYMPSGQTAGTDAEIALVLVTNMNQSGEASSSENFSISYEGTKVPVVTVTLT